MAAPAIVVEGLGKRYRIAASQGARYVALRDVLTNKARALARRLRHPFARRTLAAQGFAEFWALRGVSFRVEPGEVVGIIGRNGAGKSTLLKLLSRITHPTTGRIRLRGRVGSLLEVGTGFHPELTGRQNVYLNGVIMGMRKREIDRKFDEIVAFGEVEQFIDTPVKRYSSGMYMRLAFAVAAYLEPDVLVVDEVLAVGDAAFQKKCLAKMGEVAGGGRTVLFVSHNMQAVRTLCRRCVLLSRGEVIHEGGPAEVVARYYEDLRSVQVDTQTAVASQRFRRGSGAVRFSAIRIHDAEGEDRYEFQMGETVRFTLGYEILAPVHTLYVAVVFKSSFSGEDVTSVRYPVSESPLTAGERGSLTIELPQIPLRPGEYPLYFWLGDADNYAYDVVDELTAPLMVRTDKSPGELGFDPTRPAGYFTIGTRLISNHARRECQPDRQP